MAVAKSVKERIRMMREEFIRLSSGKESLLEIINEAELSENVFNSNAIENSTLTLEETEKILFDEKVSRNVSVREVFEAKNLASVMEDINNKKRKTKLSSKTILYYHNTLIGNINGKIAGRFREKNEYVRVGPHIAPPPEHVERMIESIMLDYENNIDDYLLDKIAKFHLDFENIHPFVDGNGRIGRVIINIQLQTVRFPWIIIRDKEKDIYYRAFREYDNGKNAKTMEKIISMALMESLHKRISYLKGQRIITLAEYSKSDERSLNSLLNFARRQTISAFRERGVWKIGAKE